LYRYVTALLRIKRRGVSVARDVPAQAAALCDMNLFKDYPLMVPILIPNEEKVLNAVADGVGAHNEVGGCASCINEHKRIIIF
jgi:hypothetical protein